MLVSTPLLSLENERQRSVNNYCLCILDNQTAVRQYEGIIEVLAAVMGKNGRDNIATTS